MYVYVCSHSLDNVGFILFVTGSSITLSPITPSENTALEIAIFTLVLQKTLPTVESPEEMLPFSSVFENS